MVSIAHQLRNRTRKFLFIGPERAERVLVEDSLVDIKNSLARDKRPPIQMVWEKTLVSALATLEKDGFEAVLIDLFLPGGEGPQALEAVRKAAPDARLMVVATTDQQLVGSTVRRKSRDAVVGGMLEVRLLSPGLRNVIEGKPADRAGDTGEAQARTTLESIGDAVLCTDAIGYVTYLNGAAEKATGWLRQEAIGHLANDVFRIVDGVTREPIRDPLQLTIMKNKPMVLKSNAILIRRNGSELTIADTIAPIRERNGKVSGAVVVFKDVSEARAAALKVSHLAHHDFLTDLPNRILFDDRLNQSIGLAQRHQRHIAVLFLDCDNFKHINDSLGHMMGDLLLQSLAKRIVAAGRSSDTVSRQGGDEFIVLLPEVNKAEDAATYASKILSEVAKPHLIGEHELHLTASIGIAIYPADGQDAETLIHNADIALYEAKESGRNTYKCFRPGMKARALERQSAEGGLLNALEKEELILHYQPRMDLRTGAVTGAEALVRWRDPVRGIVSAEDFIPLAEDSGLIVPIGRWVLHEACRQAKSWRNAGLSIGTLAVNVSPVEFRSSTYLDGIADLLANGLLEPGILELELTERTLMQDQQAAGATLEALSNLGIRLALDDFGTGFSSLSHLQRFAITTLKIDRCFVEKLSERVRDRSLVGAIINMGKSLELAVVAEGIETEGQLNILRELNCTEGQGFHFCHPLPPEEFATYFGASRSQ
jgi:diguanylate cyclase (GGDEF)-like protein/PAS domain S-box-containing protein